MMDHIRRISWRLGRKLYCWGRGEQRNSPECNGEYWLLSKLIEHVPDQGVLLDVGANLGHWSETALKLADQIGKKIDLHAFEPSSATRQQLVARLSSREGIQVSALALSSAVGEANFFSNGEGSGTNSLDPYSGSEVERVATSTIDAYLSEECIENVAMIKVDTEGFDFEVIKGANNTLVRGGIELLQFEYNWRWLFNKASLREVFNFIADKPYVLGKLRDQRIWIYDDWHFELDKFFEGNYVLIRSGSPLERLGTRAMLDGNNTVVPARQ